MQLRSTFYGAEFIISGSASLKNLGAGGCLQLSYPWGKSKNLGVKG